MEIPKLSPLSSLLIIPIKTSLGGKTSTIVTLGGEQTRRGLKLVIWLVDIVVLVLEALVLVVLVWKLRFCVRRVLGLILGLVLVELLWVSWWDARGRVVLLYWHQWLGWWLVYERFYGTVVVVEVLVSLKVVCRWRRVLGVEVLLRKLWWRLVWHVTHVTVSEITLQEKKNNMLLSLFLFLFINAKFDKNITKFTKHKYY